MRLDKRSTIRGLENSRRCELQPCEHCVSGSGAARPQVPPPKGARTEQEALAGCCPTSAIYPASHQVLVAIGRSMAGRLGERQGQRTDLELPHNSAEVEPGAETRDLAAEKSGLGSHFTYEQAEKVCDEAVPELVALMEARRGP
jgi:hypothetical protein